MLFTAPLFRGGEGVEKAAGQGFGPPKLALTSARTAPCKNLISLFGFHGGFHILKDKEILQAP